MKSVNMNILLIPKVLLLDARRLPIHQKVPLSARQVSTSHLWKMHTGPWLASKLCDVTKPCSYEHVKLSPHQLTNVRSVKHTTDSSLIALGLMYFVTPYSYTAECNSTNKTYSQKLRVFCQITIRCTSFHQTIRSSTLLPSWGLHYSWFYHSHHSLHIHSQ